MKKQVFDEAEEKSDEFYLTNNADDQEVEIEEATTHNDDDEEGFIELSREDLGEGSFKIVYKNGDLYIGEFNINANQK